MSDFFGPTRRRASHAFAQRFFVFHVRRRMHVVLWHLREFEQQPSAMFFLAALFDTGTQAMLSQQGRLNVSMLRFRAQSMYGYEMM
jgi:hypothetical protein